MIRFPWRFILTALIGAWVFDLLFWGNPLGVSYLIWTTLLLLGGIFLARSERVQIPKASFIQVGAVLTLAFFVFLRREPFTQSFSFLFGIILMFFLSATFLNGYWVDFRIVDYIKAGFYGMVAAFSRPFDLSKAETEQEGAEFHWKMVPRSLLPILRGLIIALPVLIVLGALLAAADPIFSDWMEKWLEIFNLEKLVEYIFRFFYIIILAYIFSGIYLFAVHPKRKQERPDPHSPWLKPFLGWTETAVVLTLVNLLFAIFLLVQFRYFFGGAANIHETGYTFSQYARRGFGELIAVAVLSLFLYLGLGTIARQDAQRARRGFSFLSVLIIAQVLVMLVSAFQRLLLYEQAYGFTRLRTYSHVFMAWLGILLLVVAILEAVRRRGRFALVLLTVVFGFTLSLGVLNVDGFVVRQNVFGGQNEQAFDAYYLKSLSTDAVPEMVALFHNEQVEGDIRRVLGAELSCRAAELTSEKGPSWPGFTWSRYRARKLLNQYEAEWASYPVRKVEGEYVVQLNGEEHDCRDFTWTEF